MKLEISSLWSRFTTILFFMGESNNGKVATNTPWHHWVTSICYYILPKNAPCPSSLRALTLQYWAKIPKLLHFKVSETILGWTHSCTKIHFFYESSLISVLLIISFLVSWIINLSTCLLFTSLIAWLFFIHVSDSLNSQDTVETYLCPLEGRVKDLAGSPPVER